MIQIFSEPKQYAEFLHADNEDSDQNLHMLEGTFSHVAAHIRSQTCVKQAPMGKPKRGCWQVHA